jgi:hypothetical protein
MKHKKRKYLGIGTAVFLAAVIISSATAVPVANNKAVENLEGLDEQLFTEDIESFDLEKLKEMSVQLDVDITPYLQDVFNNAEFRSEFEEAKTSVLNKIEEEFPEEQVDLVKQLFHFDETFSFSALENRFNSVNPDTMMEDVQNQLKIAEDSDELFEKFEEESKTFLELLYDRDGQPDPESQGLRNVSQFICECISIILEVLILILTLIFPPDIAILTAILIYINILVFIFSPIIIPIILWDACLDALEFEPGLQEQLWDIYNESGTIGLLALGPPVILVWTILEKYIIQSIIDVGMVLFLLDYDISDGNVTIITSQNAPRVRELTLTADRYEFTFTVTVKDDDKVRTGEYRDAIQVGFNWTGRVGDNPLTVDEWTPLKMDREVVVKHTYENCGIYEVSYISRDQWGAVGEWKSLGDVVANKPPIDPILTGPTELDISEEGSFQAVSTDPEGDQIFYRLYQDEIPITGWLGPYDSGETKIFYRSWEEEDTYTITVQAKDSHHKSAMSNSITVTVGDPDDDVSNRAYVQFHSFFGKFSLFSRLFELLELIN